MGIGLSLSLLLGASATQMGPTDQFQNAAVQWPRMDDLADGAAVGDRISYLSPIPIDVEQLLPDASARPKPLASALPPGAYTTKELLEHLASRSPEIHWNTDENSVHLTIGGLAGYQNPFDQRINESYKFSTSLGELMRWIGKRAGGPFLSNMDNGTADMDQLHIEVAVSKGETVRELLNRVCRSSGLTYHADIFGVAKPIQLTTTDGNPSGPSRDGWRFHITFHQRPAKVN
jgi:hypothetical protein